MSVTVRVDEALLRNAERATDIHDWDALVQKGLQLLSLTNSPPARNSPSAFDFDSALAAAEDLPELTDEEFDQLEEEMNSPLPAPWSECR